MGKHQSKIKDANANVINEVDIENNSTDLSKIEICLYILTILIGLKFVLQLYKINHKNLKKKYLSRSNDLDRV